MAKLKVKMVISGYVHELIRKLHSEYSDEEWSGIARIEKKDGHYLMTDIRFPKQSNRGAETEIKDGGLEELLEDIFTNNPEQLHEWKCWIHSHHSMGCFRSGTDENAKRSFNDGNLDYRWSVVTAYNAKGPTYKCALNVFKPVNIEFDIPVSAEHFDMQKYMSMFGQDYDSYLLAIEKITTERDASLNTEGGEFNPTNNDILKMVEIFNVEETQENIQIINGLLKKEYNKGKTQRQQAIHEVFDEAVDDVKEAYQVDYFSAKLKELEDNIIQATYSNSWNGNTYGGKKKSLFDNDINNFNDYYGEEIDVKYKNNTKKSFNNLGGFTHGSY